MDSTCFVFVDETGVATTLTRRPGAMAAAAAASAWSMPSRMAPWKTTTFVAGLRQDRVVAPLVLDGPMTGEMFSASVEQMLAPSLEPGAVVVMDNLKAHKVAGVEAAIRAVGASLLYLPPYSPDLNPIEQVFAKFEALLRKVAARTKEVLWSTIGQLLEQFSPDECANYLANCGYDSRLTRICSLNQCLCLKGALQLEQVTSDP